MKQLLFLALIGVFFLGCSDKEVQLAQLNHKGMEEIRNHSGIWIFYEEGRNESRAVMNKNNKLQNTHWIFHIDKRLNMGELAPILNNMQEDHDKDSMHKKEGMRNYFSFADAANRRMSLLPFSKTDFRLIDADDIMVKDEGPCRHTLLVQEEDVVLDQTAMSLLQLEERLAELVTCQEGSKSKILLSYHEDLSFQRYLEVKASLDDGGIFTGQEEWVIRIK